MDNFKLGTQLLLCVVLAGEMLDAGDGSAVDYRQYALDRILRRNAGVRKKHK